MFIFDTVIIGGGIAGLYMGYKLSNNGQKVLIIEKNNYIGGKIYTYKGSVNDINFQYEAGAGRFSDIHFLLNKLIDELNLKKYKIKISNEIVPIVRNLTYSTRNKLKTVYQENNNEKLDNTLLISKILNESENYDKEFLKKITFYNLAQHVLSTDAAQFLYDSYGYISELLFLNANDAIRMFKTDFNSNNQYYILKCGMSEICKRLKNQIKKNGSEIILERQFLNYEYIPYNNKIIIKCNNIAKGKNLVEFFISNNLVLAIPKLDLMKIEKLNCISNELNSVIGHDLTRVYAIYPKNKNNKVWFHNLGKITTDNPIQYIIPIDKEKGLIMISYSDAFMAQYWKQSNDLGNLKKDIKRHLINIFPKIKIPEPIYIKCHHWENGAHFYRPGYDSKKIYKKILNPIPKKKIYIVGECYSFRQAWIEGALETSQEIINKLIN